MMTSSPSMLKGILVVEDDSRWRNFFERILSGSGFHVVLVDNAEAALGALRDQFFPVVVVDLRLFGHNDREGLRLVQEIGEFWHSAGIQTIMVTAHSLQPFEAQSFVQLVKHTSIFFVAKDSFDRNQFLATIDQAFDQFSRHLFAEETAYPVSDIPAEREQTAKPKITSTHFRHLTEERQRLRANYERITKRIKDYDTQIALTTGIVQQNIDKEARDQLIAERAGIIEKLEDIEKQLSELSRD